MLYVNIWVYFGVVFVVALGMFILGAFSRNKPEPEKEAIFIGHLVIDPSDPEEGGGVYLATVNSFDPRDFRDGEELTVKVMRM